MRNSIKNKKLFAGIVAVLAAGFADSYALADEGTVREKVALGFSSYESPTANGDIYANYPTLGLGVTYIWPSRIFADFSIKTSIAGARYNADEVSQGLVKSDQPFARTENSVTVGKSLEDGMQVNAGIFASNTVLKLGQLGQFSRKMTGFTAGVGKGFAIGEGSSIGINGAVALLSGSNRDRFGAVQNSKLGYGLSLGAVYTYTVSKNFSVSVDAKYQEYFIKYSTFTGNEVMLSTALTAITQF